MEVWLGNTCYRAPTADPDEIVRTLTAGGGFVVERNPNLLSIPSGDPDTVLSFRGRPSVAGDSAEAALQALGLRCCDDDGER